MNKDIFHTDLDLDHCQQRVATLLNRKISSREVIFGRKEPIRGWIRGNQFFLFKKPNYGNIFLPVYKVTIDPVCNGTTVAGKVKFPAASVVLLVVFLALSGYFALPIGFDFARNPGAALSAHGYELALTLINLCLAGIFFLFGVMMYFFDGRYLKNFVRAYLA